MARPRKKIKHLFEGQDHEHMSDTYWGLLDEAVAAEDAGNEEAADELYHQADVEWERFYSTPKERTGFNHLFPGSYTDSTSLTEVEWIVEVAYQQARKTLASFRNNLSFEDHIKDIVSMTYESIETAGKYDMMWSIKRRTNYIKSVVNSRATDLKRRYKKDKEKHRIFDENPIDQNGIPLLLDFNLRNLDTPEAVLEAKEAILNRQYR